MSGEREKKLKRKKTQMALPMGLERASENVEDKVSQNTPPFSKTGATGLKKQTKQIIK